MRLKLRKKIPQIGWVDIGNLLVFYSPFLGGWKKVAIWDGLMPVKVSTVLLVFFEEQNFKKMRKKNQLPCMLTSASIPYPHQEHTQGWQHQSLFQGPTRSWWTSSSFTGFFQCVFKEKHLVSSPSFLQRSWQYRSWKGLWKSHGLRGLSAVQYRALRTSNLSRLSWSLSWQPWVWHFHRPEMPVWIESFEPRRCCEFQVSKCGAFF